VFARERLAPRSQSRRQRLRLEAVRALTQHSASTLFLLRADPARRAGIQVPRHLGALAFRQRAIYVRCDLPSGSSTIVHVLIV
jgi:hypothetical protein